MVEIQVENDIGFFTAQVTTQGGRILWHTGFAYSQKSDAVAAAVRAYGSMTSERSIIY